MALLAKNESSRHAAGWFNHTGGTCNHRSYCKLAEDEKLCRMTEVQLRDRLREVGLLGEKEQEKRKAEVMSASKAQSEAKEREERSRKEEEGERKGS